MTLIFKRSYVSRLRLAGLVVLVASSTAAFAGQCIDGISGGGCLRPNTLCPHDVTSRKDPVSPADAGATLSPSSKILTPPWIATPDRDRCGRRWCPPLFGDGKAFIRHLANALKCRGATGLKRNILLRHKAGTRF